MSKLTSDLTHFTSLSDKITIHQLEVKTLIGTHAFERQLKQTLWVTLQYSVDATQIAEQDAITPTVIDYDGVSQSIIEFGAEKSFFLLETFAEKLAERLFILYSFQWLQLEITKPAALKNAKGVTITLCRHKISPALA